LVGALYTCQSARSAVCSACREVGTLKVRLQEALEGKRHLREPPASPAVQQELAAARARAEKAEAVSSQHFSEVAALKGWQSF
jgi:hypothetical protein